LKHAQQLQLYALCTLLRYPKIVQTTNELWYLDKNELASFELRRSSLRQYLKLFDKRGRAVTEAKEFKPRPNVITCRWCPYAPHNQGDCGVGVDPNAVPSAPRPVSMPVKRRSKTDGLFSKEDLSRYTT
jgi:hypothetical protein